MMVSMARRRKEWAEEREEQLPEQERAPASRDEAAPEEEQDWRAAPSPQEAVLRLQKLAGNQGAMRVMQRLTQGGAGEAAAGPEAQVATMPRIHELAEEEPEKQIAAFREMEHLPPEAHKLIEQVAKISDAPEAELGALAQLLKIRARALLRGTPSQQTDAILDKLCAAVADAWAEWKLRAILKNVIIMAAVATEGEIEAPAFAPLVLRNAKTSSDPELEAVIGLAGPLGEAFNRWQKSVKMLGLPLYPSFQAFPGPVAPPTPNVPVTLALFKSDLGSFRGIQGSVKAGDADAAAAAHAVAAAMDSVFPLWLMMTMVVNLLGTGPVPSFAPPIVPVGPVSGGTVLPVPGVFV